ncbi:MAG TPA: hypothetical protein VK192_03520 [Sphingomicrobium sp.]|jgi:hypothetical protein|nr:hypothetical protein [Sphingomicrobium sp.]
MASAKLRPLLIAMALVPGACDGHRDNAARSSVTVKLPPARPAIPRPGFTIETSNKVIGPADDRSSAAVHQLAASL